MSKIIVDNDRDLFGIEFFGKGEHCSIVVADSIAVQNKFILISSAFFDFSDSTADNGDGINFFEIAVENDIAVAGNGDFFNIVESTFEGTVVIVNVNISFADALRFFVSRSTENGTAENITCSTIHLIAVIGDIDSQITDGISTGFAAGINFADFGVGDIDGDIAVINIITFAACINVFNG